MNADNFIESQSRLLDMSDDNEFSDMYSSISNKKLGKIFASLHKIIVEQFNSMNTRLPTNSNTSSHFWAENSRQLIHAIEISERLEKVLSDSPYAFHIDTYYKSLFNKCKGFLSSSGGSPIPPNMDKVEIYYTIPLFIKKDTIRSQNNSSHAELKLIGEGSYAQVFKYEDTYYDKTFALKRAKKGLNEKEIERFRREFEEMRKLKSPYVLEVHRYFQESNEYVMEYIEKNLDSYISKNNTTLSHAHRKNIGNQILKGFSYIHLKGILHRDISPKNILVKEYDDILVVKISDFGLVKVPESELTSAHSELKGYFNDPILTLQGFDSYSMIHETYALTRLIYFVMTGKTKTDRITNSKLSEFVVKGINPDASKRFKSTEEIATSFKDL